MDPPLAKAPRAKRLLSMDGGGVKGISSMMILDAIMKRVRELEDRPTDSRQQYFPLDYFDLAGGTSTGGLAILMLFRLELSTEITMEYYDRMSKQVFRPKIGILDMHSLRNLGYRVCNVVPTVKKFVGHSGYDYKPLEKAIDTVALAAGAPEGGKTPLLDDTKRKMLMCSTLVKTGKTALFRSYTPPADGISLSLHSREVDLSKVSINDASRATSAAPTYLPKIEIDGLEYWDGGLLNNNPIDQVWDARFDLAESPSDTPVVSCVVSIGTSLSSKKHGSGFFNTISEVASFATNTEA